ncbi:MAG: hypothetical protein IIC35_08405 [Gemmatimonadetes bacterium]|nr:hypothetical protein [Gemmatimonadota bacterium]
MDTSSSRRSNATAWIQALLFGVEAGDPISYAGAALVFVAVGAVASWIPAQRATHVDAMRALASE